MNGFFQICFVATLFSDTSTWGNVALVGSMLCGFFYSEASAAPTIKEGIAEATQSPSTCCSVPEACETADGKVQQSAPV